MRLPILAVVLSLSHAFALPPQVARAYEITTTNDGEFFSHWPKPTVTIRIQPSVIERFGADGRAAVEAAAAAWAYDGVPTFVVGDSPAQPFDDAAPDVGVYLVSATDWVWNDDELANTLPVLNEATGEILRASVLLNGAKALAIAADRDSYDLQGVLTHELGHALGMSHSSDARATMRPRLNKHDLTIRDLSDDDVEGVTELYREAAGYDYTLWQEMGCQVAAPGAEQTGWPNVGEAACFFGFLAFMAWIRRRDR